MYLLILDNPPIRPQEEYQVRRPPLNLNPITYSNTTDSLQIYENCALVPSYSEALLMSPNGDLVNRVEASRRNSSESRRGIAIMSTVVNSRRKATEMVNQINYNILSPTLQLNKYLLFYIKLMNSVCLLSQTLIKLLFRLTMICDKFLTSQSKIAGPTIVYIQEITIV